MQDKNKPATIYDIAEKSGISATTVSRVVNNKGYIAKETRKQVLKACRELNYTPNHIARSLKARNTMQIILAVPYVKETFNFDLIDAVQSIVKENGYSLLLSYTEASEKEELKILDNLQKNYADALILTTTDITEKHLRKLENIQKPVVLSCFSANQFHSEKNSYDYVGVDTLKGLYMAAKHLADQGHSKIAYVGPPTGNYLGDERYKGYCLALRERGLDIDSRLVFTGGHTDLFGYEAGKSISGLQNRPTAICAATDLIALGIYRAFGQSGIKIPEDISIVGMDNIDLCTLVYPKISSVSICQAEIGRTAAGIIFERLGGRHESGSSIIFQPRLVVRESSIHVVTL